MNGLMSMVLVGHSGFHWDIIQSHLSATQMKLRYLSNLDVLLGGVGNNQFNHHTLCHPHVPSHMHLPRSLMGEEIIDHSV